MTADFDRHARTYADEVSSSVAFSGKDVGFFARRKAHHLLDLTRRHFGDPGQVTALDIGCGVGVTDAELAPALGRLHGIDVARDAVAEAAERNPTVSYTTYDGETLPYADGSFDLAFAICVLHHVEPPDRVAFTAEIARVVRPGGLLAIFEHNPYNPLTRVAVSRCEFDEGVQLLSRTEVANLTKGAGLEQVEASYILFLPVDGRWSEAVDRACRWLPLGSQHYVAAERR